MSGLLDKMQATPRSKGWGLLADALTATNDYAQKPDTSMPMGKANPVLSLLANAVSLPSAATTADRVSYGDSLMQGKGQTLQMRPETADVALMAPFSPRTALGLLGGIGDAGAAQKAMNILFVKGGWKDRARVLDNGIVEIPMPSAAEKPMYQYKDMALDLAHERFAPKYDGHFRFTNNLDEPNIAKDGLLRNSRNHADGTGESGLSVASGPHYAIQGYSHGYRVGGDAIGFGSDGETLLNPKTIKVLSDLEPSANIVSADRAKQKQLLKDAGLPEDYFTNVQFLNKPSDLWK